MKRTRRYRAIRASARVALFVALTVAFTVAARWVWAHPDTAFWVLMVVLVPTTLAGNRWSKQKEKEHDREHRTRH